MSQRAHPQKTTVVLLHMHVCIPFACAALHVQLCVCSFACAALQICFHMQESGQAVVACCDASGHVHMSQLRVTDSPQTGAPGRRHDLGPDLQVVSLQWCCTQPYV